MKDILTTILLLNFIFPLIIEGQKNNQYKVKDVDAICVAVNCGLQSTACALDVNCAKVLACMTGCFGQDDEAACQFICQWELGQANEKYLNLLKCMAEHGCLSMQPDGICLGDSSDTTNEITTMDSIQGDWWILKGQNCGQDEIWNGGYDAYPCQKATYVQLTDGSWIRNTTFCFGHGDTCTSEQIIVSPPAVIESPGVIYTTYYDLPLYMNMEERYYIVERIENDWMFYFWCSENLAAADAGVVVLGRSRALNDMPEAVENRFRELAAQYGLDYDAMCVKDNTNCQW